MLAIATAETAVEPRLAEVLSWLDAHPGWLLILDNVDTEDAAREVHQLLARLRAGHVLITSWIANWRAGLEPLELHVLAPADAVEFLLEWTPDRRGNLDDTARAAEIARELDGLALALEQTLPRTSIRIRSGANSRLGPSISSNAASVPISGKYHLAATLASTTIIRDDPCPHG